MNDAAISAETIPAKEGPFTDQKRHVANEVTVKRSWSGGKHGKYFRCYLCGVKFEVGDGYRWIYSPRFSNLMVCDSCDGPDVLERWVAANEEAHRRFWWAFRDTELNP